MGEEMIDVSTATGQKWDVIDVGLDRYGKRRGDGDTCDLVRSTIQYLGDKPMYVTDIDPEPIRLVWVDTPERGKDGWALGKAELTAWLERKLEIGPLTVICYGSAGWDRQLGDLISYDGESASQWLMIHGNDGKGWPPYVPG